MRLREFVRTNRKELDEIITHACPNIGKLNDEERERWVINDEGMYLWARGEGCQI